MEHRKVTGIVVFGLLVFALTFAFFSFWNRPAPLQGQLPFCPDGRQAVAKAGGFGKSPASSNYMAQGDFNGDGKIDVALGGGNVFLGYGNGNFVKSDFISFALGGFGGGTVGPTTGINTAGGGGASAGGGGGQGSAVGDFAAGDITGDGNQDIVLVVGAFGFESVDTQVQLYKGNGDGTFEHTPYILDSLTQGRDAVIGQFSDGSALDIFVTGEYFQPDILKLYSDLANTIDFSLPPMGFPQAGGGGIGITAGRIAAGDFNADGKADIFGDGFPPNAALQQVNGNWTILPVAGGNSKQDMLRSADNDRDGDTDVFPFFFNNGQGTFTPATGQGQGLTGAGNTFFNTPVRVAVGPQGDDKPDIAYYDGTFPSGSQVINITAGTGNPAAIFGPFITRLITSTLNAELETGDVNRDGMDDILAYYPSQNIDNVQFPTPSDLKEGFSVFLQTSQFFEDQNGAPFTGMTCFGSERCGDGIVQSQNSLEQCDDGNTVDDDGCDNNCRGIQPESSSSAAEESSSEESSSDESSSEESSSSDESSASSDAGVSSSSVASSASSVASTSASSFPSSSSSVASSSAGISSASPQSSSSVSSAPISSAASSLPFAPPAPPTSAPRPVSTSRSSSPSRSSALSAFSAAFVPKSAASQMAFLPRSAIPPASASRIPPPPSLSTPRVPTLVPQLPPAEPPPRPSLAFSSGTVGQDRGASAAPLMVEQPNMAAVASSAGMEEQILGIFVTTGVKHPAGTDAAPTSTQICGDGFREGSEQCDDGNNSPADGCNETCRAEIPTVTANGAVTYVLPAVTSQDLTADILAPQRQAGTIAPAAPQPPRNADSGPAAIAFMAAGASAGWAWMRRRRKENETEPAG